MHDRGIAIVDAIINVEDRNRTKGTSKGLFILS